MISNQDRTRNNESKHENFRFKKDMGSNMLSDSVAMKSNRLSRLLVASHQGNLKAQTNLWMETIGGSGQVYFVQGLPHVGLMAFSRLTFLKFLSMFDKNQCFKYCLLEVISKPNCTFKSAINQ